LWNNWYRKDRWNLWARSGSRFNGDACIDIAILKTTMIVEAQYGSSYRNPSLNRLQLAQDQARLP
jgi:hypothetical protein